MMGAELELAVTVEVAERPLLKATIRRNNTTTNVSTFTGFWSRIVRHSSTESALSTSEADSGCVHRSSQNSV